MAEPIAFPEPPRMPAGTSIVAFGDVHGRLDLLEPILRRIETRAAQTPDRRHVVVSLGDIVDRGPDSAGVVERLLRGVAGCELVVLKGNHEQVMLDFWAGTPESWSWLTWGGLETLASYGIAVDAAPRGEAGVAALRRAVREHLPQVHLDFFRRLPLSVSFGDYFFVHAGARPGVPLAGQSEHDLLWIREELHLSGYRFEKKIVHGHTPVREPEFRRNRINLDTGAFATGRLTAALFEDDRVSLL